MRCGKKGAETMNPAPTRPDDAERTTGPIDGVDLKLTVAQVLDRWPCAGFGRRGDP
jgi:hypothetical protein